MVRQPENTKPKRKRSVAWLYYALISIVSLIAAFGVDPRALIVTAVCGAYSVYLFRGGRFVLWIW
jgi:hypothetical protein